MMDHGKAEEGHTDPAEAPRASIAGSRHVMFCMLWLLAIAGSYTPAIAVAEGEDVDARLDLLFGEHDPYRDFFRELQAAVAANARERVAALVNYPLKTHIHGHVVHLRNPQQFIAQYEVLLSAKTQDVLAHQSFNSLFANSQGVMVGNGQIWFSGVCKDDLCKTHTIKITAFNP
jgi:hypothetical protein